MKKFNHTLLALTLFSSLALVACGGTDEEAPMDEELDPATEEAEDEAPMDHSGSGDVPAGLEEAENPAYPVGSEAMIVDGHMPGMENAIATIVGAYETTAYVVSFTTEEGDQIEDHKWVVHEEIEDAGETPFEAGTEVVLNADHMEGMSGATAEIVDAEETTVFMVDFTTNAGEEVTNHKWVAEAELAPIGDEDSE
ncbi:hypothetical protein JOC54_002747 [Alkalihalobacillus xiaoxiensis]|uniref:DUF1541 domain-containing protein n=1 Tax=Shouchella xiaoxiensis TaxID=766895 RepID=A0ABS2SVE1_9BACI|nr:YdhK family protein [Shouchella xiaoxiensis]MBM7839467.1 hypothetical protein [Shouchella xiaoxiensis]